MDGFLRAIANAFVPIFVAIDIFVILPMFLTLTKDMTVKKKERIARQSIITALAVSLIFAVVGEGIFKLLGITPSDFKVAGGIVLLVFAILDFVRYGHKERLLGAETVGVVPLGVPLIVGPAVLTTMLVLIDHYGPFPTIAALILNLMLAWLALHGAGRVVRVLGQGGIAALSKIMAILLASIAVMMIRLGIEGILKG